MSTGTLLAGSPLQRVAMIVMGLAGCAAAPAGLDPAYCMRATLHIQKA